MLDQLMTLCGCPDVIRIANDAERTSHMLIDRAKREAVAGCLGRTSQLDRHGGPVVITDRGRPSHVLLTFEEYDRLASRGRSVIDLLGMPAGVEDIEIEMPDLRDTARPADLR